MGSVSNHSNLDLPTRLCITMGDPAGIGPEVVLKALKNIGKTNEITFTIVGDFKHISSLNRTLNTGLILRGNGESQNAGEIRVFDLDNLNSKVEMGVTSATCGKAAGEYIKTAVDLWESKQIDAIVTAPINKEALQAGGFDFPGHTEFLAELTGTESFAMSFFAGSMAVVLLSTHVSLQEAIGLVKKDALVELISFAEQVLRQLLSKPVKIAVAGLNPHASEHGLFGEEEAKEITPAITYCREVLELDVSGPFSPDTVFLNAYKGAFDAVISCYHDQATIAVKCLSFGASVNVTLGLPLIRTSVDHGTAFEIAGMNKADPSSMVAAIKLAAKLARIKQQN
ncbi:MAG: 4-hydroxythreonine-4-phosphate dehydrogenase PdxA [Pyrinomonadaceae bacterium]